MPDITAILEQATARTLSVRVCLAGDVAGELDRVLTDLAELGPDWAPTSMGDVNPRTALEAEAAELRQSMRAASVDFAFRALGHTAFSALIAQHPAPAGNQTVPYDEATFLPALLAACCTDPVMDAAQAAELLERLNNGQVEQLYAAALQVNEEPSPIPF